MHITRGVSPKKFSLWSSSGDYRLRGRELLTECGRVAVRLSVTEARRRRFGSRATTPAVLCQTPSHRLTGDKQLSLFPDR